MPKRATSITGAAGEHLVAARLSAMGFVVAVPRGGSPTVDLLAASSDGRRSIALQVKSSSNAFRRRKNEAASFWEWQVAEKLADLVQSNLWFVFVDLCGWPTAKKETGELWMPEALVAPAEDVIRTIQRVRDEHWKRCLFRVAWPDSGKYWERWDRIAEALGESTQP